ncbi:MAG: glycosyltransferase [Candidatus Iainarchaeum archaeon]|uniref:Glycosyltransferase n=1 Tax=Candidatus Iainarchaeum sp. TaxID=3101447 RepID=A0A7T9I1D0_9ARCH|nr:MAG: glycosyltransferase [Candidatus Diapherotrites archaeon]
MPVELSIILPTYNERENIRELIPLLARHIQSQKWDAEVMVVDDQSPDGTGDVVEQLQQTYPFVQLLRKPQKKGIGDALRYAYDRANGRYLLSMDADLSLRLDDIQRLYAPMQAGKDMVVGSKYAHGSLYQPDGIKGSIQSLFSRAGGAYMQAISRTPISDFNLNFRMLRRETWKAIAPREDGNFFLAEMVFQAHQQGFAVAEVPVSFLPRKHGKSKTNIWKQSSIFLSKTLQYQRWI